MAPDDEVAIPLAFQPPPPGLNAAETKQIDSLQQEFVRKIGGPGPRPAPPEIWNPSQREIDERFRALFGQDAFLAWKNRANQHAGDAAAPGL